MGQECQRRTRSAVPSSRADVGDRVGAGGSSWPGGTLRGRWPGSSVARRSARAPVTSHGPPALAPAAVDGAQINDRGRFIWNLSRVRFTRDLVLSPLMTRVLT